MNATEEYRKWRESHCRITIPVGETVEELADAAIAELEAENKMLHEERYAPWRQDYEDCRAALAERDRMLRIAILDGDHPKYGPAYLADLQARAKEGKP